MFRRLLLLLSLATPAFGQYVSWTAPSSATAGVAYTVTVTADAWLQFPEVTLYKNGFYAGYGMTSASWTGTDTGTQLVAFYASGFDDNGVTLSGSWEVSVAPGSAVPVVATSGPPSLTPGQSFSATASVTDADGDLSNYGLRYQGTGLVGGSPWFVSGGQSSHLVEGLTAPATVGVFAKVRTEGWDAAGHGTTGEWLEIPVNALPASFAFSGGPTFTYSDAGAARAVSVTTSATYDATGTWSATEAGSYTATATANGNYTGTASYAWSIAPAPQSVSVSTPNTTITAGATALFTASGGGHGGYTWGGSASGTGATKSVTFAAAGSFQVTVQSPGDSNHDASNTASITMTVTGGGGGSPPVITSATSASGTVGAAFSYTITATNAPTGYTAGGLPGGLLLEASTGAITGTPTQAGSFTVSLGAGNASGTGTATLSLTIAPAVPPPPAITSPLTATGTAGSAFSYTITASGSPTGFGASGLPAGLMVNATTGAITGTPALAGSYPVTLTATNSGGTGTATLSLTINASVALITYSGYASAFSVPAGAVDLEVWTHTECNITDCTDPGITVFGPGNQWGDDDSYPTDGTGPDGAENCGKEWNAYLKVASPPAGSYSTSSWRDPETIYWRFRAPPPPAPVITSAASANASVGSYFTFQVIAANAPTTFSATGLPAGLNINYWTGRISGTPQQVGLYVATIAASNTGGTGTATLTLAVGYPASQTYVYGSDYGPFSFTIPAGMESLEVWTYTACSYDDCTDPGITVTGPGGTWSNDDGYNDDGNGPDGAENCARGYNSYLRIGAPVGGTYNVSLWRQYESVYWRYRTPAVTPPVIPTGGQPVSMSVNAGQNATFSVTATGGNLLYRWRKDGVLIAGAEGPTYTITGVQSAHAASYTVYVWNGAGSVISNPAVLTVNQAPVITSQPASRTIAVGQPTTFTVAATGAPAPTYRWHRNGVFITGATSATYTIPSVQLSHAGNYTVEVSNPAGTVWTTPPAVLTVNAADTQAPSAPGSVQVSGIMPTEFTATWTPATDNIGVTGYQARLVDETGWIPVTGLSYRFGGLAANSTYNVEVQAQDAVGLWGPAASLWVTTAGATGGPGVPGQTQWIDTNGDGILDKVTGSNSATFTCFIDGWFTTNPNYASISVNYFMLPWDNYYGGDLLEDFGLVWQPTTNWWSGYESQFYLDFAIDTPADRALKIYVDMSRLPDIDPSRWNLVLSLPGFSVGGWNHVSTEIISPGGFDRAQYFLVEESKPMVAARLDLPAGTGTLTVDVNVAIGKITLPGGWSVSNNGTVTITSPGGTNTILTAGGQTLIGDVTINVNATGEAILTLPGGAWIKIGTSGRIDIQTPAGSNPVTARRVDPQGNEISAQGIGTLVTRPVGGSSGTAAPTSGATATIYGRVGGGLQQLGIRYGDTATIWFTIYLMLPELPMPKLAVDANRDGQITFDSADATSSAVPYRFWLNDDDDGNALNEETEVEGSSSTDYSSRGDFGIASRRDLEDFARLWINSAGIADALKSGALQMGLQWKADPVTGSPAINLYRHYEANGGTGYLTDNAVAIQQTTPPYSTTLVDAGNKSFLSPTNGVFVLKKELFANLSSSQTKTHLLFEGAGVGKGILQLLLLDQSGAQIGEGSSVWLDIRRINTMFERVKATTQYALSSDGIDATMPLPHDYIDPAQVPQPTMGWTADDRGEAFVPDPSEDLQNKNYIVFVHGWRQAPEQGLVGVSSALTYARTMYKRLWHSGYKGRFAAFRWPTFYGGSAADDDDPLRGYTTYNDSEYRAWKAGQSLAQYVNQLPSGYRRRVTAHSMGNIVAGSAFKYGMTADSYALLNAAVPALCYEETALRRWPTFTGIYGWLTSQAGYEIPSQSPNAPDSRTPVDDSSPAIRALSYVRQLDAISADVVNFYLEADFATSISWNANNVIMRPHTVTLGRRYGYGWGVTDPGERLTLRDFPDQMIHRHPSDPHEVMAYDCKVPTFTVNATGGTGGSIIRRVNLQTYGFDREHSAQWQWRFQQTSQFYQRLLSEFGLTPTL